MTTTVRTTTAVGHFRTSITGQAGNRHVSLEAPAAPFKEYFQGEYVANSLVEISALAEPEYRASQR